MEHPLYTNVYFQGWTEASSTEMVYSVPGLNDQAIKKQPLNLDSLAHWKIPHSIDDQQTPVPARVRHVNYYSISTGVHERRNTQSCFRSRWERCIDSFQDGCHYIWSSRYFTRPDADACKKLVAIEPNDLVSNHANIVVMYDIEWLSWPCVTQSCGCHGPA